MNVEQIYTGCLAQAAYYIESNGEAAIIDPLRETSPYIELAEKRGTQIKYIFETHFHADFISGHIALEKKSGAKIVYGPTAKTEYNIYAAKDGEVFHIGGVKIKVLHTPGHTLESSCYLLIDENGKDHAVFTGDTLFIGDVGRPDLAVKDNEITNEDLAGMLYDSIHNKLMKLSDDVIVYPGHGAGSQCGKNISAETQSTIGQQKQFNYALQEKTKEGFIKAVTEGQIEPPQYFFKDAAINKTGYEVEDDVIKRKSKPLTNDEFEDEIQNGALALDTRIAQEFKRGFIKGAINIGLDGSFAIWVGTLIENIEQPFVLITEKGRQQESIMRLARVGYENVKGYLKDGLKGWIESGRSVDTIESIVPEEFEKRLLNNGYIDILDVRRPGEYEQEQIADAINMPLDVLSENTDKLDKAKNYYLHCRSGYRSMIASSILKAKGIDNLTNIEGGIEGIKKTNVKVIKPITVSK